VISHWDDLESHRRERGHIAATWTDLAEDRSLTVGVQRIRIDPGKWATPLHLEGNEEEIFFVLAGDGISLQWDGEKEEAYPVRPGDCLVHLPLYHGHTLQAGPDGIDVLAFGQRSYAANTLLPRAGVSWLGPTWVLQGAPDDHPWTREAAAGPPTVATLADRPPRIVNVDDLEWWSRAGETVSHRGCDPGRAANSVRTGLQLYDVTPGMLMNPPHAHSAEEEIFVVLAGDGDVELWPHPRSATEPDHFSAVHETFAVTAGSTVCLRAGLGRPASLRAGQGGLRVLAYGTRDPNDICFYPRSGKVSLRGVGVIGRLEPLAYWDGED
jgi:uncharacterized cupin superfamily protein